MLTFTNFIVGLPFYFKCLLMFNKSKGKNNDFKFGNPYPILNERHLKSGTMSGHYFHQDLLIAKKIFLCNPNRHLDIGSRIDGFVAHVASFREIEVMDIRDQISSISGIKFQKADLMQLPPGIINQYDSISALHSIEHFGLGRYGDPINFFGHLKAIENIYSILKANGKFYFSVPIGNQRIEFNAHRIFSISYLLNMLNNKFHIINFSYVDDNGALHENVTLTNENYKDNFNCTYGCGIFELLKI